MPVDAGGLAAEAVARAVEIALAEDLGDPARDLTSEAVVPAGLEAEAHLVSRARGIVAGLEVAAATFRRVDPEIRLRPALADGEAVASGSLIATVGGPLASLLGGERVALNFLQRLSGVATLTRAFVDAVVPFEVEILDTRKTTPGLRELEKYAVRRGGGRSHRRGLYDAILIKDNHVVAAGGVGEAVRRARATGLPVEVEVDDLEQLREALAAGAEVVLLDNMSPPMVAQAVQIAAGRVSLEVSGGVSLANVRDYAATGVARISVGALTHSAPAHDISMEVTRRWRT